MKTCPRNGIITLLNPPIKEGMSLTKEKLGMQLIRVVAEILILINVRSISLRKILNQ